MRYDLHFPLDSQVVRIFCLKKCLTALREVTCVTHGWILVQVERGKPAAFLNMVVGQERLYLGIMSHVRLGKYVWVCLVNEDNWACRLGHYILGFSLPRSVGWRVWAKAHGTHNAPIFPTGEVILSRQEKENVCDLFDVRISEPLMLGCSNVRITEEFPIFGVTFNAALWRTHEA